jgi:hypothetical protein
MLNILRADAGGKYQGYYKMCKKGWHADYEEMN